MLAAFSIDELLEGFGFFTLGILLLAMLVKRLCGVTFGNQIPFRRGILPSASAAGGLITQAVGIAGLLLWLSDYTEAWRPVWSVFGLNRSVFPDLNGKWKGTVLSNGPLHGYKELCSRPESETGPPTGCTSPDLAKLACLPVEVTVSMSLVTTDVELFLCNLHSHSTGVTLKRRAGTFDAKLSYLFDVPAGPPTISDSGPFAGSASLDVNYNKSMRGYYWTDRNWKDGRQTAGYVDLIPQ